MDCQLKMVTLTRIRDYCQDRSYSHIDVVPVEEAALSVEDFCKVYMVPNVPCIFGNFVTEKWPCRRDWVAGDGTPDFDFLERNYGYCNVPVANCNEQKYYGQPRVQKSMKVFLKYWKQYRISSCGSHQCLYLKDWHFVKDVPSYIAYETPTYFTSDWLNEYWASITEQDDYRFVYMGPKGSWTPYHADVFRSNSWSANICGRKKWIFTPPGHEEYFRDYLGNLPYDLQSSDLFDKKVYPNSPDKAKLIEVIQEPGTAIFVPSGWHHQVLNLEDTISLNHNWLNGFNIDIIWSFLQSTLAVVKKEIQDCKDMENWDDQCQVILKALSGMNYVDFFKLLSTIAHHRCLALKDFTSISDCCYNCDTCRELQQMVGSSTKPCKNKNPDVDSQSAVSNSDHMVRQSSFQTNENMDKCVIPGNVIHSLNTDCTVVGDKEQTIADNGSHLMTDISIKVSEDYKITSNFEHFLFDLWRSYQHLRLLLSNEDFKKINLEDNFNENPVCTVDDIMLIISKFYCNKCLEAISY